MGDLGTRFHLSIISPWLLILLNFCSILKFSDAANLYIPDYPTSSCAPSPLPQRKWGPPLPLSPPGEGTATGRLVWVTGKKGSVVFIVFCLRESPPHPSDLIWYHSLFSIPKVSEGFLSFFFLLKHNYVPTGYWWSFYLEDCKSHSEPKGVPERSDPNPNAKSPFSVVVFRRFLVALCFVVAATWLKNVSREIWKQCPGAKVCCLMMLRSPV